MAWLKDMISNVQERMHTDVEQRKQEIIQKKTNEELMYYQEATQFPSDDRVDEAIEDLQHSIDVYTLVEILMDNGLTTKEEYHKRRKRLEDDLKKEIRKQLMEDLREG